MKLKELYRVKLSFLGDEVTRHESKDLLLIAKDWTKAMKIYMNGVKDAMLSGADQLTSAICISEGKKLM